MTDATPHPAQVQAELDRLRGSVTALAETIEQLLAAGAAAPVRTGLRIAKLANWGSSAVMLAVTDLDPVWLLLALPAKTSRCEDQNPRTGHIGSTLQA